MDEESKEPTILRCIKALAGVDWKAMAIVVAALAGLGGAIWNRVDALAEKVLASRTQQGVYELLAQRLDTVDQRLGAVEKALEGKPPTPALNPEHGRLLVPQTKAAALPMPAPTKAALLPPFETIQQSAREDRMPELLDAIAK